ncbi:uncharacterized protein EV420DRAFT_971793 [Desarmillaria tabescens]|uniref:Uncharacterized protein n=1 Tax=Armillaria tabescens TaxID=1929756 RepID=A0AA39JMD6_ARMTA|nr:uncharacterized protein EV420DRAFT_971793 [Desarmillaria tabescens]KAK0445313.1 hypothetical protein EV420DRAFT_971793 [Desarmillaria tabescens]
MLRDVIFESYVDQRLHHDLHPAFASQWRYTMVYLYPRPLIVSDFLLTTAFRSTLYYLSTSNSTHPFTSRYMLLRLTISFCFYFATSTGGGFLPDGLQGGDISAGISLDLPLPVPLGNTNSPTPTLPSAGSTSSGTNLTLSLTSIIGNNTSVSTNSTFTSESTSSFPPSSSWSADTTSQTTSQTTGSAITTGGALPTTTSPTSQSTSLPIIGATVGSFVFILLLLCALIYTLHRRQHRRKHPFVFHRDMMVRQEHSESNLPLTPAVKDSENTGDAEKHALYGSTDKEDPAPSGNTYRSADTAT